MSEQGIGDLRALSSAQEGASGSPIHGYPTSNQQATRSLSTGCPHGEYSGNIRVICASLSGTDHGLEVSK